jgi:cytochrome c biogenesis protein CcmG/thiol:disulfide interchange protein DsbE
VVLAPRHRTILLALALALAATVSVLAVAAVTRPTATGGNGIAKGEPAPDIVGTTLDGAPFRLADLRGHPVVVNFWGPSCDPCRTEFPLLKAKLAQHASEGLVVVGILTDDPADLARIFVTDMGATWPTVVDPGAAIKKAYRVVARPQTYFIDRSGVLRSIQVGEARDADFERQFALITGGS